MREHRTRTSDLIVAFDWLRVAKLSDDDDSIHFDDRLFFKFRI